MSEAHCNNLAQRKALGLVTHDNTGGPFVVECQGCGEVYPSLHCLGGEQIADTGDHEDARCPHCDQVDPEECDNAALAWNTQQLKINELQQRLNAADQRIDEQAGLLRRCVSSVREQHCDPGEADFDLPAELMADIDAQLSASTEPEQDDDWHMNPCKQGHRDVGASGGVAACNQCDEKIEAATTQEAFERWNATHLPSPVTVVMPDRSPEDYAIEHAEYMAKSADDVLAKFQAYGLALLAVDEGGDDGEGELFEAIDSARQDLQESLVDMRGMVYEFRKRSNRCTPQ